MSFKKGVMHVFVANVINLIISLFTGFVLPKYLSIETYSNIKLFQLYISYIGILHLGFADGMYIHYGGKNISTIDKKQILDEFKTFKVFQVVVTVICIVISLILKNEILLFCSLVIFPVNIGNYLRNLYQAIGQFKRYSKFTNINTILLFIINIILLLIIKTDNYYVYILSYCVVYFIYCFIIENENRKLFGKGKARSNREYLFLDIRTGFFLMIGNFCNVIFTSIDRIFVKNLLGMIKFAFYSFAVSIENLMSIFVTPISTVMYNYLCNNDTKENVIRLKKVTLLFSAIIISVIFPAKFVINMWISKYIEAVDILFILFAAQYMSIIIRIIHINLYKAHKKQNRYFAIMVSIVLLSVILNVAFYMAYKSMEMIAIATLITNIIWFVVGEIDFRKYRLKIIEYIYFFCIMIIFIFCGKIGNAIYGLAVYVISVLILTIMFMRSTLKYCISEAKRIQKKVFNR